MTPSQDEVKKSLYDALVEAGIEVANHESDLYFPVTAESTEILKQYPLECGNATRFMNQIPPYGFWYDVPFAYTLWWVAKTGRA